MPARKKTTPAQNLPVGLTSTEVIDLVDAGAITAADGAAYLKARMDAAVAKGRKPRYAARKAYEALAGVEYALAEGLLTRKGAAAKAAKAAKAPAKAAAKAPAKGRKAPAKAPAQVSLDDLLRQATSGFTPEQIAAAFMKLMS